MTNVSRRITLKKNYILALFAGLLFLSFVFVNVGSGLLLGRQKLDLTGDGRYTLSEASRRIVSEINSPLYIRSSSFPQSFTVVILCPPRLSFWDDEGCSVF